LGFLNLNHYVISLRLDAAAPYSGAAPLSNIFNTAEDDLDYLPDMSSDTADDSADAMRTALGERLLELRRRSGKTLREAAKLAELSPAFVSLVERGQTEIGLSRLIRLADAYDANIADLLAEIHGRGVEYVRAADTLTAPRSHDDPKVTYLTSPSWQIQPFRIEIEPGASLESLAHAGEEFIHCVAGQVQMTIAGSAWTLEEGDTIVVPPRAQHAYRNNGNELAVVVGAVAPPNRSATPTNDRRR
jgi:quercetin dioxygenase-like cupin family protein